MKEPNWQMWRLLVLSGLLATLSCSTATPKPDRELNLNLPWSGHEECGPDCAGFTGVAREMVFEEPSPVVDSLYMARLCVEEKTDGWIGRVFVPTDVEEEVYLLVASYAGGESPIGYRVPDKSPLQFEDGAACYDKDEYWNIKPVGEKKRVCPANIPIWPRLAPHSGDAELRIVIGEADEGSVYRTAIKLPITILAGIFEPIGIVSKAFDHVGEKLVPGNSDDAIARFAARRLEGERAWRIWPLLTSSDKARQYQVSQCALEGVSEGVLGCFRIREKQERERWQYTVVFSDRPIPIASAACP